MALFDFSTQSGRNTPKRETATNLSLQQTGPLGSGTRAAGGRLFINNKTREPLTVKPYRCKLCDEAFTLAGTLKRHMMSHSGENPHKCELCNKAFLQKGDLKLHMLVHSAHLLSQSLASPRQFSSSTLPWAYQDRIIA